MADTINTSDFCDAIGDLLSCVSELNDIENMIDNIELGHLEESTTGLEMGEPVRKMLDILGICKALSTYADVTDDGKCFYLDWAVNRK